MTEMWKPIKVAEDYEVSNFGRVRSVDRINAKGWRYTGRLLKLQKDKKGYLTVGIMVSGKPKTFKVHRLVAFAFLDKVEGKEQINHIDGDKTNNNVMNLEWCNNAENQLHAVRVGLKSRPKGEKNARATLTEQKVSIIKLFLQKGWGSYRDLARLFGVKKSLVADIGMGRTWKEVDAYVL